jgi:hypothetical protein
MRTALDAPFGNLDKEEQNFVSNIMKNGWFGTHVSAESEGPGFSFTTGFWVNLKFPEVIVFSLKAQTAHDLFWHMFREAKAGKPPIIGKPAPEILEDSDVFLFPVAKTQYEAHLDGAAGSTAETIFPACSLSGRMTKGFSHGSPVSHLSLPASNKI